MSAHNPSICCFSAVGKTQSKIFIVDKPLISDSSNYNMRLFFIAMLRCVTVCWSTASRLKDGGRMVEFGDASVPLLTKKKSLQALKVCFLIRFSL